MRNELKIDSLKHALRLKIESLKKHSLLALLTDANADINNISRICSSDVVGILIEFITIIGYVIGLSILNWKLTLLVLLIIPVKVLISNVSGKAVEKKMTELLEIQKQISRWQNDTYPGVNEIKNWNLYSHVEGEFAALSTKREKIDTQMSVVMALDSFLKGGSEKILMVALYAYAATQIWNGSFSIGTFFAFIQYSAWIFAPIDVISGLKLVLGNVIPSAKSYIEFHNRDEENFSSKNKEILNPSEIRFEHVSFGYSKNQILRDFSLTIKRGEKVAIVGANGSGKSTIVNLLLRYYSPSAGAITFDDDNVVGYDLKKYRDYFSVMGQDVFLFNTSVENNINMFDIGTSSVGEHEFLSYVDNLPEKGKTIVGFNGSSLSGGEKQRIALARAIAKDAKILILDEATSNCDVATEAIFNDVIDKVNCDYIICITHNFELIKDFDRIIILDEGRIIADGNFQQLHPQLMQMQGLSGGDVPGRKKLSRQKRDVTL